MKPLKYYKVPEDIESIASFDDASKFNNLLESRSSEEEYLAALRAMIYMEEHANSEQARKHSIKDVEILFSCGDIFKFEYAVRNKTH